MAVALRISCPGVSSGVFATDGSSIRGAADELSACSTRRNPDGAQSFSLSVSAPNRRQRFLSKGNPFLRSADVPFFPSWTTHVSTEEAGPLSMSSATSDTRMTTIKLTFLIDLEEEDDGSVLFKFGTVDHALAWDKLVAYLYKGVESPESVARASAVCQELIGVADLSHSGPTYYSGNGGVVPRWALMKEMLKDFSQAVPLDRQVVSRAFVPHTSDAAGVWERSDGIYGLGGGARTGRPGRRSPGWPETHSVGGQQVSSLEMLDWPYPSSISLLPGIPRDQAHLYAQRLALPYRSALKLLDAPRHGVIQLKLQTKEDAALETGATFRSTLETDPTVGATSMSTAFIWLPSTNEESVAVEALNRRAVRSSKVRALQAGQVVQVSKPLSSICETKRRQQKRSVRNRKAATLKRETLKPRDLCYKNPVLLLDFILGHPFMQTHSSNAEFLLALRKEYAEEVAACLNQVSVGLAGGGLAMLLYVASRMLCVNAVFDNCKFIIIIRGVGLLWLSAAMRSLRRVVLSLKNECAGIASKARNREQVARLKKELKYVSYKALSVVVLSVVGAA